MTFEDLYEILENSRLFSPAQSRQIVQTCGRAGVGNAVLACELIGISLRGSDIDALYDSIRDD
jgi:hypothetical protein